MKVSKYNCSLRSAYARTRTIKKEDRGAVKRCEPNWMVALHADVDTIVAMLGFSSTIVLQQARTATDTPALCWWIEVFEYYSLSPYLHAWPATT